MVISLRHKRSFNFACGRRTNLRCYSARGIQNSLHNMTALKNDFVLQARGFWWAFGPLSLDFCYLRFAHIAHDKNIGNRKQTCWKNKVHWVKQTMK